MAKLVWIMLSILLVRLLPIPTAPVAEIRPESIVACVSADDKSDFVCLGSVTELDGYSRTSSVTAEAPI